MLLLWLWPQSCVAYLHTLSYQRMHQHVRLKTLRGMVVISSGVMSALNQENLFAKESRRRLVLFLSIPSIISILSGVFGAFQHEMIFLV